MTSSENFRSERGWSKLPKINFSVPLSQRSRRSTRRKKITIPTLKNFTGEIGSGSREHSEVDIPEDPSYVKPVPSQEPDSDDDLFDIRDKDSDGIYIVKKGKCVVKNPYDKYTVKMLYPGDLFGENDILKVNGYNAFGDIYTYSKELAKDDKSIITAKKEEEDVY